MKTLFENLKQYFQSNTREQIEQAWAEFDKYNIVGPTVDEFIHQSKYYNTLDIDDSYWEFICQDELINYNPKFASDFFLY
ncbi:hypothetical protein PFY12_10465 [Chryseobacterium camelliae]|uniref:Uncharacterized protein n=1 Tax=Chryseobacterium camelliae TaxID=1265445 RepID=A0ABY7QKB9_9FLAO|nr:hypothetical protein [Chryseobacterium camelliae]WBV59481.1 hypothetical protein PFY12_10465 [Chryseobacterium camelliae]